VRQEGRRKERERELSDTPSFYADTSEEANMFYTITTYTFHLFTFPLLADYHYDSKDPDQDYADMQAVILRSLGLQMPAAGIGAAPVPPE